MPEVTATVHKDGLHPMEAFKAHHLSQELGMSLDDIFAEGDIRNLSLHQARAQVQGPAPDDQSLVGRARLERERAR